MASRYSQEYFFQHTLMNVSLRNLNEIIHPNAENIPDYIRHYASAMFVNKSFSNDNSKILQELQLEGHRNDYIESYMSYVEMQCTTYKLVIKGKFLCAKLTFFIINTSFLNSITVF